MGKKDVGFLFSGGSNGSDDETAFNDNASIISNASSGSFMRDDCVTSGEDTTDELSQVPYLDFQVLR
jgi:hypothetical protein